MTSRSRNILIILGVMTAIGIAVVGYGGYKIYSIFTQFGVNRDVPPELQEPRVTTGAGLLRRSDFSGSKEAASLRRWAKVRQ